MSTHTLFASAMSIERLIDRTRWPTIDGLLREYVPWALERLGVDHGVRFDDADGEMERHHAAFAADAPLLLAGRGRLLLAHLHGEPVGMVALKPLEADLPPGRSRNGPASERGATGGGEVKRMFVRDAARGHGIGRALLARLLADAQAEGFHTVRLETLSFMTEARALYRSLGFVDGPAFRDLRGAPPEIARMLHFMTLRLQPLAHTDVAGHTVA